MGQPITLAGKAGEKLSKVGYVSLGDITISSNPYHTKGDSHPSSSTGVPVFSVMRELATFSVNDRLRKSKARVVTEIRAILGDFPDSRILRVRVSEGRVVQVPQSPKTFLRAEIKRELRWYKRNAHRLDLQYKPTDRAWRRKRDAILDQHANWLEMYRGQIHICDPFVRADGRQEYRITRRGW
jgi:hypothetical protein